MSLQTEWRQYAIELLDAESAEHVPHNYSILGNGTSDSAEEALRASNGYWHWLSLTSAQPVLVGANGIMVLFLDHDVHCSAPTRAQQQQYTKIAPASVYIPE